MQPNNQTQKPFFAQFLEDQAPQQEESRSTGSAENLMTLKFPSDREEDGGDWLY
ncbi:Serine endopeptidase inhibitors [Chitinophaga rupis]|uniref:Serine endopeptidase inhibitors n=1 Tax=Chitinophaga rupis TaxID=573321 RepID=A0A1H7KUC3_9BACT|nr:microviridin/marinostatin family tricyclic proteinase inhibitor [Chitinophaga rupis]SEK90076.1 Serine endopeptidase inhibitors [Chitinophaga rupis]